MHQPIRRSARRPSTRRGMTLREVMVSSAIVLVALLGVAGAFSTARRATGIAKRQVWAARIAHDLVSQVNLWPYEDTRLAVKSRPDPADTAGQLEGPNAASVAV